MNNHTFKYLASLLLCGIFLCSSASAAHRTPVIIFKDMGSSKLLSVVGYPNNKPTILFYPQTPMFDENNTYNPSNTPVNYPRIYRTDNLTSIRVVSPHQFENIFKNGNISDTFIINALPVPDPSEKHGFIDRTLTLQRIIWFNNSYYALGVMELNIERGTYFTFNVVTTRKLVILESNDGFHWSISNDNSQNIPVPIIEERNVYLDNMNLIGSGDKNDPTLALVNSNQEMYYKHLKSNSLWKIIQFPITTCDEKYTHYTTIQAYKDKFLLIDDIMLDKIHHYSTKSIPIDQYYYISDDGENWHQLTSNISKKSGISIIDSSTQNDTDETLVLFQELDKNSSSNTLLPGNKIQHNGLGKIEINQDSISINRDEKVFFPSLKDMNISKFCNIEILAIPSSKSMKPSKYYINFYQSTFKPAYYSTAISSVANSFQDLSNISFTLNNDSEQHFFDIPMSKNLISFNNQAYFLASIENFNTTNNLNIKNGIDTIFYRIDD